MVEPLSRSEELMMDLQDAIDRVIEGPVPELDELQREIKAHFEQIEQDKRNNGGAAAIALGRMDELEQQLKQAERENERLWKYIVSEHSKRGLGEWMYAGVPTDGRMMHFWVDVTTPARIHQPFYRSLCDKEKQSTTWPQQNKTDKCQDCLAALEEDGE